MNENDITRDILDAAIKIHRHFGPGMIESVYERLLESELQRRGHIVERQKPVSFEYEGQTYEDAFRVDLFVDDRIVVELKATESMNKLYPKQVKTYLVAMNLPLGVLINFGMDRLVDGFSRVVNGYDDPIPKKPSLGASAPSAALRDKTPSTPLSASAPSAALRENTLSTPLSASAPSAALREQPLP